MVDHLALRTGLIDAQVRAALARGARQLVLLGAGLDARGHRSPELAQTVIFEVDHPNTQAYKRKRTDSWPQVGRDIRYVPYDLIDGSLERALSSAGFDPKIPTCVVCEGVTMYLKEAAVVRALAALSRLCAPRSTLIVTYIVPGAPRGSLIWKPGVALLAAVAEPFQFASTPEAMSERLAGYGFVKLSDTQPLEEAPALGVEPLPFRVTCPGERERLIVAERAP
jgi:methyltransferase (TIGR00027 family)